MRNAIPVHRIELGKLTMKRIINHFEIIISKSFC